MCRVPFQTSSVYSLSPRDHHTEKYCYYSASTVEKVEAHSGEVSLPGSHRLISDRTLAPAQAGWFAAATYVILSLHLVSVNLSGL